MVTKRLTTRALAGLTLVAGFGGAAQAQLPAVTAEDAFKMRPRQPGVNVATPTPDQVPQCRVDPIPNPKDPKVAMGYVVRDPAGKPVRQLVSYDGKSFNIVAYYVNGAEAYREVYPPQPGEPFQFRWLGPNGTKWGLDRDRDGRVDEWVVISPEELSQELFAAVMAKDVKRVEALTVTKANLEVLGLPAGEAQKLLDRAASAGKRVGETADALKLTPAARWDHLQLGIPQSTPADALGARDDLVVHKTGTVLVQDDKDSKFLQTGELVQVGRAWKLIDGPTAGPGSGGGLQAGPVLSDKIKDLVAMLDKIDREAPNPPTASTLAAYNARRVEVLEQIVAKLEPKDQDAWVQQLADSLSGAAEGEKADGKHIARLKALRDALKAGGNQGLAAYTAFRYLIAENSVALSGAKPGELPAVQEKWRAALEEFIAAYPAGDDAAEAMLRLAMAYEFQGKDGEPKAKEWYDKLARKADKNPHQAKGAGALKRLDSEGKPLELAGPNLANGQPFNVTALQGKVVVVYYCASWSSTLPEDAKKLAALVKEYGPKGLELVTVCLDNDAKAASQTVTAHAIPGTHLHAPGGLDGSPLAAGYGILVVPHLMVAGKDGKVVNRNAQVTTLEDDVKKLAQ